MHGPAPRTAKRLGIDTNGFQDKEAMTEVELRTVLELSMQRRKAYIELLVAEEDFLISYGRISRRACLPKNRLKNGSGRGVVPQGVARRP